MSDVKNHSTLPTSLISYWELEEASGTRVDSHGSNDLSDNNTVGQMTGKQGDAADFEKANSEYLSISDASQSGLDISGDFSIALWYKPESTPSGANNNLVAKWRNSGASQRAYALAHRESGGESLAIAVSNNGSSNDFKVYSQTLTNGTWYHIVATYDASASQYRMYVDGSEHGSSPQTGSITSVHNSTDDFAIGADNVAAGAFNHIDGAIDEVGIWSKVLTSSEVSDLYSSGTGIPYDAGGGGAEDPAIFFGCNF